MMSSHELPTSRKDFQIDSTRMIGTCIIASMK